MIDKIQSRPLTEQGRKNFEAAFGSEKAKTGTQNKLKTGAINKRIAEENQHV